MMTSVDKSRNLVAAISYVLGFITGIVILLVEKDDKFIRFHAMQSTIFTGGLFVLNMILGFFLSRLGIFSVLSIPTGLLIWIIIIYACFVSFVRAYNGKVHKLPFVGDYSEARVR